jgi:ferritin-like metal-binding protein YciE
MKIDSLHRLYVHQLKDLYSAEKQLLRALPKMAKNATNPELKAAFESHTEETQHQVKRLEKIFEGLEFAPTGETCDAMKGLISEGEDAIEDPEDDGLRDAAMLAAAQKVEHYEISGYGTVRTYAELLGRSDDVQILEEILAEEKAADAKLNNIAMEVVNLEAATAP